MTNSSFISIQVYILCMCACINIHSYQEITALLTTLFLDMFLQICLGPNCSSHLHLSPTQEKQDYQFRISIGTITNYPQSVSTFYTRLCVKLIQNSVEKNGFQFLQIFSVSLAYTFWALISPSSCCQMLCLSLPESSHNFLSG